MRYGSSLAVFMIVGGFQLESIRKSADSSQTFLRLPRFIGGRLSPTQSFLMNAFSAQALPPIVLTFAANDPSGGAGLPADLMTIASLGCHPLSVTTALTVQDTIGVRRVLPVDAACVSEQARIVLADIPVAAFKIGLLGSIENVAAIAEIVAEHPGIPLVFDPVLASGRGERLVDDKVIVGVRELLIPLTTILTPNSLEARRLLPGEQRTLAECADSLLALGCAYVLVTGTHEPGERVVNTLYARRLGALRSDAWDRLPGSYHGSGCTLASAIAAQLARGMSVEQAVWAAQEYTWQALAAGFRPGRGQFIPNRFAHSYAARGGEGG